MIYQTQSSGAPPQPGRLGSEEATRHRYATGDYLDTARKHGLSALTAIRDALAGNPWIPPTPDPP